MGRKNLLHEFSVLESSNLLLSFSRWTQLCIYCISSYYIHSFIQSYNHS